jgi:hypothetical protein
VLVDAHKPREELSDRLSGHPDAERLIQPQALAPDLVEANKGAKGGDGK